MGCLDEQTLSQLSEGQLPPERAREAAAHLERCPHCRRRLSQISATLPPATVPDGDHGATVREEADAPGGEDWMAAGTLVDYFRIQRPLGRGGMGEVYLARDTRLGRLVALKMVRPESLGSRKAASRFLFEARTTARFNHPHIVTVYAVGEDRGRPYLALEYLEGQTLRQRLDQEGVGVGELLRIGLAIAEALEAAHRSGVFHRDLKPQNVMLARDGRLRVLDFGLARAQQGPDLPAVAAATTLGPYESRGQTVCGTPGYMAPEQWQAQESTAAADVWALGVMLYEMAAGRQPFPPTGAVTAHALRVCGEPPPPLPEELELPLRLKEIIARCLEKNPSERPTASEGVELLRELLSIERRISPDESPFRGLLPFAEAHHHLFFGRETEIAAFVERLRQEPVLPVVGPSGAGKSSFVQAGIIPRLRERGRWLVLSLRPGTRPLQALAARVLLGESGTGSGSASSDGQPGSERPPVEDLAALEAGLRESPARLALHLGQLARSQRCKVLLFVDQLEELYAVVEDEQVRRTFMRAICLAAADAAEPVRVVFTLRDDFLGRVAEAAEAREALSRLTVLRSPGPEGLEQALVEPLKVAGYSYDEPALVQRMMDAVRGQPAALPLLQFTGQMLWERRDRAKRLLCQSAYDEMGGVAGALAHHAEGVLDGLSASQVALARRILLRLVTAEGTRQVVTAAELLERLDPAAGEVVDRLVQARLIVSRKARGRGRGESELELVHESLINNWSRLQRWLGESRGELAFVAEMRQAVELWERRGRREDEVWQGEALREALRAQERCQEPVPEAVQRFLEVGLRREGRRRRRRRLLVASAVGLLALVALAAIVVAFVLDEQRRQVQTQKARAEAQGAVALREGARSALLRGSPLEARAKYREALEGQDSPAVRALGWQLARHPLVWKKEVAAGASRVAFSPDGRTVAVAVDAPVVYLVDVQSQATRVLRGHQAFRLCFSPDGARLLLGTVGGKLVLWDVERRRPIWERDGHASAVYTVAISPDGRQIASGSSDHTLRLWSMGSTGPSRTLLRRDRGTVSAVAFSPDGKVLAAGGTDDVIRLVEVATGEVVRVLEGHGDTVHDLQFSDDGRWLVSGSKDHTLRVWRMDGGGSVQVLRGHTDEIWGASISPDGALLASASRDNTVRLWDRASGATLRVLRDHTSWVECVRFGPRGRLLATGSVDRTIRLWRVDRVARPERLSGHSDTVWRVAFSPDGALLASASADRSLRLWRAHSGRPVQRLLGHRDTVWGVAFGPGGKLLASSSSDRSLRLWDVASGATVAVLLGHTDQVHAVAFHPDGKLLASGARDKTVRIWDVASAAQVRVLEGHWAAVLDLGFDGRGRLTSGGDDKDLRVWDVASGRTLQRLRGHRAPIYGLGVCADGSIASASVDRTVRLWPPGPGARPTVHTFGATANAAVWNPGCAQVGVGLADGTCQILAPRMGQVVTLEGHRGEVTAVRFSPDGKRVATAGTDGTVRLWDPATGQPVWRAPLLVADPVVELFTHQGWIPLDPNREGRPVAARWRQAVATRARLAAAGHGLLCLWTHGGQLEIWEHQHDRRLLARPVVAARRVLAVPGGCATLDREGRALLHPTSGGTREVGKAVAAMTWQDGKLLLAGDGTVAAVDRQGVTQARYPGGSGVSAVSLVESWIVVGYPDGNLERAPLDRQREAPVTFEGVPSSAVTRLLPGPRGTVVAGFANGLFGLWSVQEGTLLHHVQLHGAVIHLLHRDGTLYAASELGDHRRLDLSVFNADYCELVRRAWRDVPMAWRHGRPVPREPPPDHRCATGR